MDTNYIPYMRTKSQMLNKLFYGTESVKKLLFIYVYIYTRIHVMINTHICTFYPYIGVQNLRC
jgi:hypothetical protein